MADPTSDSSVDEMNDIFLDGITCPYQLFVADSRMPEAGFGLFVREEIPAGKEIFRAMPVISVVESSVDACDNCFRYRDINTQILKPKEDTLAIRMFIRLVVLHQHGQVRASHWKAISALKSHKESIRQSKAWDLQTLNADIDIVREMTECDMPESEFRNLYWQININQHSVDTPLQPKLGSCLAPIATLINHSCDPNAHHLSEGPELVIRSSRKIAKDEEITISYIDPTQSFEERQKALSTTYVFACQCCKCAKGFGEQGDVLTGNSVLDAAIQNAKSNLHALSYALADGTQGSDGVETKMREICNESSSGKPWPIDASPLPTLYELLASKFEDEQQWQKALCVWLKIVYIIDPLRYPERLNPHRVAHLMALCQLEVYVLSGSADKAFNRISQMSEISVGVKAAFHTIEAAMSMAQYCHNIRLKEDAAGSLGTNHAIFKAAAHNVEAIDKQKATSTGVPLAVWQSERFKDMRKESYESGENKLLKWAHIDLTTKTI